MESDEPFFDDWHRDYLRKEPLAREILLKMAESKLTICDIAGENDTVAQPIDHYIFISGSLSEGADHEGRDQLKTLVDTDLIGRIPGGMGAGSRYYLAEEIDFELKLERNEEYRKQLIEELTKLQ